MYDNMNHYMCIISHQVCNLQHLIYYLHERGNLGHHHHYWDTQLASVVGESQSMVTGRSGNDTSLLLLL